MLRIFVTRQSRYPADVKALKRKLSDLLARRGVVDANLSVALVGARKSQELSQKYLGEEGLVHEVLSFPSTSPGTVRYLASPATSPSGQKPDVDFPELTGTLQLGDIVICYPEARKIAIEENRMMDDVLVELAEHGTLHLLGEHHED